MKKFSRACLSVILAITFLVQTSLSVFAAGKTTDYVSEVILSYGDTAADAKKWLTDSGYKYVDCDLNDGADDAIWLSKERAVYLGYKTTNDPEEAITDMKLMNMDGGYSVQDYQMLLNEEKDNIKVFISQFITAVKEYRTNYKNNVPRATAAHDILNMIIDDDTGMKMGDLLLEKIKEEYSDADFAALSAEEQKKHADMTTILMQGNAEIVLYIEQLLASSTDTNETLWLDRFAATDDYDTMLETVMDEENVTPDKAETILASRYDEDAKKIGSMAEGYREWIDDYISSEIKLTDSEAELTEYWNGASDEERYNWYVKGSQYELLNGIAYDEDISLLDLFISGDYELTGDDSYMLYPIVEALSSGQRACLDFINGCRLVTMGCSTDSVIDKVIDELGFDVDENNTVSVFDGVDRSIYGEEVALTGEAYKLQNSDDSKNYADNWFTGGINDYTIIMASFTLLSAGASIAAFVTSSIYACKASRAATNSVCLFNYFLDESFDFEAFINSTEPTTIPVIDYRVADNYAFWSKAFSCIGVGLTIFSILLAGLTLMCTYEDLKAYYNTDFTPIPTWMVDQTVDENNEKAFTYYKVVNCNRIEGKFTADNTKLLNDSGDINGDVGKQWLALYTTTDKNAGDPIVADFKTQTGNSDIPGNYTPLSIFCNQSAQNLTDAKSGFTYNDSNGGIYLFYNTQSSLFTGSAVTTGICAAVAGGVIIITAAIFLIIRNRKKKTAA